MFFLAESVGSTTSSLTSIDIHLPKEDLEAVESQMRREVGSRDNSADTVRPLQYCIAVKCN